MGKEKVINGNKVNKSHDYIFSRFTNKMFAIVMIGCEARAIPNRKLIESTEREKKKNEKNSSLSFRIQIKFYLQQINNITVKVSFIRPSLGAKCHIPFIGQFR